MFPHAASAGNEQLCIAHRAMNVADQARLQNAFDVCVLSGEYLYHCNKYCLRGIAAIPGWPAEAAAVA